MKRIIYVAGSVKSDYAFLNRTPCFGYSNWLKPDGFAKNIEESTIVLALGGADVSPQYYRQKDSGLLNSSPLCDEREYADFIRAIKLNKKIIGTCKGMQWGAAVSGGAIFQDINHPYQHEVTTFDGKKLTVNSGHHNMADLSKLKEGEDYTLLAWAENISSYHINGDCDDIQCPKEPEVVFYKKTNWLGFQNHNENLFRRNGFEETIAWSQDIVERFLADTLP